MDNIIKGLTAVTIEINKRRRRSDVYLDPKSLILGTATSGRTPPGRVAVSSFKVGRFAWEHIYTREEVAESLLASLTALGYIGYEF